MPGRQTGHHSETHRRYDPSSPRTHIGIDRVLAAAAAAHSGGSMRAVTAGRW